MNVFVDKDCVLFDVVDVLDSRSSALTSVSLRRFVLYAERPAFQAKLCEEVNGQLVEVADIPSLKEGSGKIVPGINKITVYGSARFEDNGAFKLCSFDFEVAGVYPLNLAGAARLRSVCKNIIKPNLHSTSLAIDPYCK